MAYRCFLLEETGRAKRYLRRYAFAREVGPCSAMASDYSYHVASVEIEEGAVSIVEDEGGRSHYEMLDPRADEFRGDQRWLEVAVCPCGRRFTAEDAFQVNAEPIMRRVDTGELTTRHEAEVGAMWDAWWFPWRGVDGRSMMVKCPGGDWAIDSQASNCTRPTELHQCWVRHGEPPDLTVDKNGDTCNAGGGSIWIHMPEGWHGFLTAGWLLAVGESVPA